MPTLSNIIATRIRRLSSSIKYGRLVWLGNLKGFEGSGHLHTCIHMHENIPAFCWLMVLRRKQGTSAPSWPSQNHVGFWKVGQKHPAPTSGHYIFKGIWSQVGSELFWSYSMFDQKYKRKQFSRSFRVFSNWARFILERSKPAIWAQASAPASNVPHDQARLSSVWLDIRVTSWKTCQLSAKRVPKWLQVHQGHIKGRCSISQPVVIG